MNASEVLIKLVSIALKNDNTFVLEGSVDWNEVFLLSCKQGVSSIAFDGLISLCENNLAVDSIMKSELRSFKFNWYGSVIDAEKRYSNHIQIIENLSAFYKSHGIRMLLLKGVGLSYCYPIPSHRLTGDIDIYLFGKQQEGDRLLSLYKGIIVKTSVEHHTVFTYNGVLVENHYDFINTRIRRSGLSFDRLLKEYIAKYPNISRGNYYIPNPYFNMLFLMKHMSGHFASEGITIRHVLDWALYVLSINDGIDWERFYEICHTYNTERFISSINSICVNVFGFNKELFPIKYYDPYLNSLVLSDIMSYSKEVRPKGSLRLVWFKVLKWYRTRWKQRICYRDSILSSLISSVFFNLRKPINLFNC